LCNSNNNNNNNNKYKDSIVLLLPEYQPLTLLAKYSKHKHQRVAECVELDAVRLLVAESSAQIVD
jgi:hypothetical protein